MRLLLFGGTFDPPHMGHMSILRHAIEAVQPDKVLVVPANQPPHKQGSETPAKLRLAMCECFCPLFSGLEISDIELSRGGRSYTIDTVEALKAFYPQSELYLCIGSDMLLAFKSWRRWQDLLAAVTLVVQNRAEADVKPSARMAEELCADGGRVLFASGVVESISSTALREAIHGGKDVWRAVPPPADEIIRENRLYRSTFSAEDAKALAKSRLSEKRFRHVANVVDTAKRLARRWGANEEQAGLAAWLHDIVKEEDETALLQMLDGDAIMAGSTRQRPFPVWHGPCAAIYAKHQLGIEDEDVLSAIGCHTTGKAGMSLLDKIVMVADMTSAERSFDGVEELRRLAGEDIDEAAIATLRRSIDWQNTRGKDLDEESVRALHALLSGKQEAGENSAATE